VRALQLGRSLQTARAASGGSLAMMKAPTGAVKLREDRRGVGSEQEASVRLNDGSGLQ
jgi:hypothetical protein